MAGPLQSVQANLLPQKEGSSVQITGAPDNIEEDLPTPIALNTPEAIPTTDNQGLPEPVVLDLPEPVNLTEEKTAFKYQEDPEIQRIAGTPEERKQVGWYKNFGLTGNVESKEIPFQDLYSKPDNLKVIKDYAETRFGDSGKQQPQESDEDYVKRWATAMRMTEWNTGLNASSELIWLNNAKPEEVVKAARAHNLFNSVPSWYDKGGQPGVRPVAEATFAAFSDPANVLGFGVAANAKRQLAKEALDQTFRYKLKQMGIAAGAEATIGVGQSAVDQAVARKTGTQRDEADYLQYGLSALIGAFAGAAEVKGIVGSYDPKTAVTGKQLFDSILEKKKVPVEENVEFKKLLDSFNADQDALYKEIDLYEGRKTLDALSPPTELTESQISKDVNKKAIEVALYVMLKEPKYRPQEGQSMSMAVRNVIEQMDVNKVDGLDDDVFDEALSRANITPKEFANSILTTASDAGKVLQTYSTLSKVLNKVARLDPEVQKRIDALTETKNIAGPFGTVYRWGLRAVKETKAFVVSGLGTTIRNIQGTSIALTADAMAKLIEDGIFAFGRGLKAIKTGDASIENLQLGLKGIISDSLLTFTYLRRYNSGYTTAGVEKLLEHNPRLNNTLFSALQETGNEELSKAARFANTFNVAQDAIFRRAIFISSVQRQLKKVGIDMEDALANDKILPASILKTAADETLKATFSYMPKVKSTKEVKSVGDLGENVGYYWVKFWESVPGLDMAVTFPRFMSNAVAFLYRYSPFGGGSGAMDLGQGAMMLAAGKNVDGANALISQGMQKFSKGLVGTAAYVAAYQYRAENQDIKPYEIRNSDGSTTDVRGVYPLGPILMVGDYSWKVLNGKQDQAKIQEVLTAVTGLEKMPAGSTNYILDQFQKRWSATEGLEADRFEATMGRLLGDYLGRVLTPGKPFYEFHDLFSEEGQKARDPNIIGAYYPKKVQEAREARGEVSSLEKTVTNLPIWAQASIQRLMAKLPVLKETLPEFQPYFTNQTPMRSAEFFNTLTGVRPTPPRQKLEQEFVNLGLDPYKVFTRTGDKVYDREVMKNTVPQLDLYLGSLLKSSTYAKYDTPRKREAFLKSTQTAIREGKRVTEGKMYSQDIDRIYKNKWSKFTANQRVIMNDMAKVKTGKSIDESKDYRSLDVYEAMLQTIM